jgi:hypothetical protein
MRENFLRTLAVTGLIIFLGCESCSLIDTPKVRSSAELRSLYDSVVEGADEYQIHIYQLRTDPIPGIRWAAASTCAKS